MIIFYSKKTGEIFGTIEGRIHHEGHHNQLIHTDTIPLDEVGKLMCEWKQGNEREEIQENEIILGYKKDEEGFVYPVKEIVKQKVKVYDMEPDHIQKDIFRELDNKPSEVYKYRVELATGHLVPK